MVNLWPMRNDLLLAWFDYQVWLMLQLKFMAPANMIARNDAMEDFLKRYSLNGIKSNLGNMCKPF